MGFVLYREPCSSLVPYPMLGNRKIQKDYGATLYIIDTHNTPIIGYFSHRIIPGEHKVYLGILFF